MPPLYLSYFVQIFPLWIMDTLMRYGWALLGVVSFWGGGSGLVSPGGVSCGDTCSPSYTALIINNKNR